LLLLLLLKEIKIDMVIVTINVTQVFLIIFLSSKLNNMRYIFLRALYPFIYIKAT